ncbi:MAG TPA: YfiR family protein [Noviherbaspirillum sp.]|jgi:hypothetical protein
MMTMMDRLKASLVAAAMLPWGVPHAQPVPEYDLKAAFVYNFAVFTDWPADTAYDGGTLNICVNPDSAVRQPLVGLGDKQIKGRRVAVRSLAAADNLRTCNVVYLDSGDRDRWEQIRKALGSTGVLTIADDEEIARDGAVISLAMDNNRVVFDVDTRAARQAKLVLSSKLLRLARTVQ